MLGVMLNKEAQYNCEVLPMHIVPNVAWGLRLVLETTGRLGVGLGFGINGLGLGVVTDGIESVGLGIGLRQLGLVHIPSLTMLSVNLETFRIGQQVTHQRNQIVMCRRESLANRSPLGEIMVSERVHTANLLEVWFSENLSFAIHVDNTLYPLHLSVSAPLYNCRSDV